MAATDGTTRQGSPLVRLSIRFYSRAFLPLKEFSYVEIRSVLDVEGDRPSRPVIVFPLPLLYAISLKDNTNSGRLD